MSLKVSDILTTRVRLLLRDIDTGGIQWKDAELLSWFNEACGEISRVRPEASSITTSVALASGARQSIPAGASRLLEIVCNEVSGVEGRIVRRVERSTLDNEDPEWMIGTKESTVIRYAPSLSDPRSFYVYPPSVGGATTGVSMVYSSPPAEVTSLSDPIPLPGMYSASIANYVLFRALAKLTESADAQQRAQAFLALFNGQMADTSVSMEQNNAVSRDPIRGELR